MDTRDRGFLRDFGRKVAEKRMALDLTQKQLADGVGITPAYVASIETGRRWPRLAVIRNIAHALSAETVELIPDKHR